jgi:hypothetical protein
MQIRNTVTFGYPAEFVEAEAEGILSVEGAGWFVDLLGKIPGLAVDGDLCQEDWGVVVFGARDGLRFWFGLSFWDEGEWIAHVHHDRLLQRFRATGRTGWSAVIVDLHDVLDGEPSVSDVRWYFDGEVGDGGTSTPGA